MQKMIIGMMVGLGLAIMPFDAMASSGNANQALMNRINQLESQLQTLSQYIYRGETPPAGVVPPAANNVAELQSRLDAMQEDVRQLRGMVEEANFNSQQLRRDLDKLNNDVNQRLGSLEQRQTADNAPPPSSAEQTAATNPSPATTANADQKPAAAPENGAPKQADNKQNILGQITERDRKNLPPLGSDSEEKAALAAAATDEDALYDQSFALLQQQDYAAAERGFSKFLASHENSKLADNARYWLAETHFARKNYSEAARLFADNFERAEKAEKAPENLLKLGLSLQGMNNQADACLTLQHLLREFPKAPAAVRQRATAERKKLQCR